ncbi:adenylyl-sulfate kinase [Marinicrinis lubricantis]|uniref:Adenylyl-sulfate kinase n=1 Tax=Marinicrinis lubricantis TaxID=2086470 RepID=A0ABW1IJU6_9BACL
MPHTPSIVWHPSAITRNERAELYQHRSCALWFTGLSGSGKSTLAFALDKALHTQSIHSYVLDGDNIRHGLNNDLGFSPEDRKENIRRIGEVSKLFVDAGMIVLCAFISPYEQDRAMVKRMFDPDDFFEIYVKCSLEECERRDPKGLYQKARNGEIAHFTGVSAQYDVPSQPSLVINTEKLTVEESVQLLIDFMESRQLFSL